MAGWLDSLQTIIPTVGATFSSVWVATHGSGSSGSVPQGSSTGTVANRNSDESTGKTVTTNSADKYQMVTLGVAGAALIAATFLIFKRR